MIPYYQMTLADVFTETQEIFETDKPEFLKLLESSIDLSELIPVSFGNHFYASTGRPREYSLTSLLWALIIQRIFSIPTDSLLLTFLEYSRDLREFCGFTRVPYASKITRFKQEFIDDLQMFFDSLVDLTEPILQEIDAEKESMSVFDTTGLEAFVTYCFSTFSLYQTTLQNVAKEYAFLLLLLHNQVALLYGYNISNRLI